jgi:hypothetical protein
MRSIFGPFCLLSHQYNGASIILLFPIVPVFWSLKLFCRSGFPTRFNFPVALYVDKEISNLFCCDEQNRKYSEEKSMAKVKIK